MGNTEIDPVFTKWVKTRSDGADDNVRAQNANTLTNIDVQLKNISNQNSVLTSALQVIASNLNVATELDKRREVAKAKRDRQAAEAGLRSGKEQQIESRIQMALMAPIKRVGAKLKFGLNRLTSFFAILLGGWLIDKTVSFLRALSEGNQDKVKEIRVTILKGLLLAGGALFLLKAGLTKITFTLATLAGTVATFGFRNLVSRPFQSIVNFLAKQRLLTNFKGIKPPGPGPGGTGSTQVTPPKTGNTKTDTKGNTKTGPKPNLPNTRFQQGVWTKPGNLALILSAYYGLQNVAQGKDIQTEVLDQTAGFGAAGFAPWMTSALGLSGPKGWMANFVIGSLLWNAGYRGRAPATQKVMEAYEWLTTPGNEDKTINDLPADLQEAIKEELGPGGQLEQFGKDLESGNIMPSAMSDIDPSELIKEKDKNTEKLLSNMMGRGAAKKRMEAAEEEKNNKEIEAKKISDQKIIASKNKSETKNLVDNLSNLAEVQPTIIPLPIGDSEQSQDGSNVAAGAQGGSVPNISSSNVANSYVYLALKHYQVAPV